MDPIPLSIPPLWAGGADCLGAGGAARAAGAGGAGLLAGAGGAGFLLAPKSPPPPPPPRRERCESQNKTD